MIASQLARVVAQFEVGSMVEHLAEVAGELAGAVAIVDADVKTLAIGVAIRDDGWLARRMSLLAHGVSGSKALARAALARTGALRIERGLGADGIAGDGLAGTVATLAIAGPATLDDDLAAAVAIGIAPDAAAALGARLRELGDDGRRRERLIRATIFPGEDPAGMALELGIHAPADILHRIPAPRLESHARDLRVGIAPIAPVTITYGDLPVEACLRAIAALATDPGAADRLRAIASERVDLELAIGPHGPVGARIVLG